MDVSTLALKCDPRPRPDVRSAARWFSMATFLVILGGCGGRAPVSPSTPPTPRPTPAPATLADLSASVTSTEAGQTISCSADVHARITVTNRSGSSVTVTGIHKINATQSRECRPAKEFTYTYTTPRTVSGNSTNTVFDQKLYSRGSGCCDNPRKCGDTCDFQETFEVVTPLGSVPAGVINYNVVFSSDCPACTASLAADGLCRSPMALSR